MHFLSLSPQGAPRDRNPVGRPERTWAQPGSRGFTKGLRRVYGGDSFRELRGPERMQAGIPAESPGWKWLVFTPLMGY